MGQKINPVGFRLAVNRNWSSRWYANSRSFGPMLAEDIKVRAFLKGKLAHASVGRVLIERPAKDARITIFSARPGVVIGKKGEEIEALKAELRRITQLIADSIAQQLEKRIMFRRAMKRAMQNAMRLGAQGIKIMSAGRLNGIEIARTEWYREGRVPLHTLRADIDYGLGEAKTNYGVIGIKVWVYKGEIVPKGEAAQAAALASAMPSAQPEAPAEPKRPKKPSPKFGAKRAPAKPRADGDKKPAAGPAAAKKDAAPAPKTAVKKAKKVVKDEGEKKE
jgi:small subunit ribosomal protein S3